MKQKNSLHKEDGFYLDFPEYESIRTVLKEICEKYKDSDAFGYCDKDKREVTVKYGEFLKDILNTAKKINIQIKPEDKHIGIVCTNTYMCIVMIYAVVSAGKTAVLFEQTIEAQELKKLANQTDTLYVMLPKEKNCEQFDGHAAYYEDFVQEAQKEDWTDSKYSLPDINADDAAFILFTSGTTGERNGVVLSNRNMAECIRGGAIYKLYDSQPSLLLVLPLYHMYGLVVLLCHLAIGSKFYINSSLRVLQKDLQKYQPQIMECVPMMLEFLYKRINQNIDKTGKRKKFEMAKRLCLFLKKINIDISRKLFSSILEPLGGNLEFIICGGAFLDRKILDFFAAIGIVVYEGYGLTETATFVTVNTDRYHKYGSVGILTPYNDVRIADGEIQIKGKNIMKEYYGNEELTRKAFDGEWFKTGDLGYIDKDGFLYLTGRKKNLLILSNGQNLSPEVIENNLIKYELIDEAVVSEKEGHIHAQIYTAMIENKEEAVLYADIKRIIDSVNRSSSRQQYIETFELRKEPFKKTVTMKIKRT